MPPIRPEDQRLHANEQSIGNSDGSPSYKSTLILSEPASPYIEISQEEDAIVLLNPKDKSTVVMTSDSPYGLAVYAMARKDKFSVQLGSVEKTDSADKPWGSITPDTGTPHVEDITINVDSGSTVMVGTFEEAPFIFQYDAAGAVTSVSVWSGEGGCWKTIPQPINPDFTRAMLPYVTTITSRQAEQTAQMAEVATGKTAVREVNPVIARLKEENRRRNPSHLWGRELAGLLSEKMVPPPAEELMQMIIRNPELMRNQNFHSPLWRMNTVGSEEGLTDLLPEVRGLKGLEGNHFIWGTSFCRADVKEVLQYFALSRALDQENMGGRRATYFIDKNAHTVNELLGAMARDFNLTCDELSQALNVQVRDGVNNPENMAENHHLPPSFYQSPSPETFVSLMKYEHLHDVLDIWRDAAEATAGQSFGDWRVQVDRLTIRRLAERMGIDPDFVQVVDMADIIGQVPDMRASRVNELVVDMWNTTKPIVQKAVVGETSEAETDDMPMVYRLVLPDGKRIGINTRFQPIDLDTRMESTSDFAQQVAGEMRNGLTIAETMARYPVQFSGIGYYMFTKALAMEKDTTRHQAVMIMDDYEQSVGPYAAAVSLQEDMRMLAYSLPKGLVAVKTTEQINFDETPDVCALLALPDEELLKVRTFIEMTADVMRGDDIGSATGVVIDPATNTVSEVTRITGRRQMMALEERNPQASRQEATSNSVEYNLSRALPAMVEALEPGNVSPVIDGILNNRAHVEQGIQVIRSIRGISHALGGETPHLEAYLSELEAINGLLEHGENLADQISEVLSDQDARSYWGNNLVAHAQTGIELGIGMAAISAEVLQSPDDVEKVAQAINLQYRTMYQEQVEGALRQSRPDHIVSLNEQITTLTTSIANFELVRKAMGSFARLNGGQMQPEEISQWAASEGRAYERLNDLMDEQKKEKKSVFGMLVGLCANNPHAYEGQLRLAHSFNDSTSLWALGEIARISKAAGSKKPDYSKPQIKITADDMIVISDRARSMMLHSFETLSKETGVALPAEIVKENGRFNPEAKTWVAGMAQKISYVTNLSVLEQLNERQARAIMYGNITDVQRADVSRRYQARIDEPVQQMMERFRTRFQNLWRSLNEATRSGDVSLQAKLEEKIALENRVHHEVVTQKQPHERRLRDLQPAAHAEYINWWNATAAGLIRDGFPVSGTQH